MTDKQLLKLAVSPLEKKLIQYGIKYGYPHCCILYFAKIWWYIASNSDCQKDFEDLTDDEIVWICINRNYKNIVDNMTTKLGYIPCPACLLKNLPD